MAYDGIITRAMVNELNYKLLLAKIDKIQQPSREELIIGVHSKAGNYKLYASSISSAPRVHLIDKSPENPPNPFPFCMLMRKHLVGARIIEISQHESDRIIEITLEALSELGFTVSKKLIIEIMGKHSNIILVDTNSGNVIDSIKRVSFDTSRVRQVLPGIKYEYPPAQDKIPFDQLSVQDLSNIASDSLGISGEDSLVGNIPDIDPNIYLRNIGGISPQIAQELANIDTDINRISFLNDILNSKPHVYLDDSDGSPLDFHLADLSVYEGSSKRIDFDSLSEAIDYYFEHKDSTNRIKQMSSGLERTVDSLIEKSELKLQRLREDLLKAEDSDKYRLYGELLTANLHACSQGDSSVTVTSYYDGSKVNIPLDSKYSPSKNAQNYFKKYGKSKTAIKEKTLQIEETEKDIVYLESVKNSLNNSTKQDDIEVIRQELVETGYIRKRRTGEKTKRAKLSPIKFTSPSGFDVLVGRNNKENDELTLKLADKKDIWLHTKDIPGSHVILRTAGEEPSPEDIYFAAEIAAWHSKAKESSQVPVDYVKVRHVKKPAGAKPGMVIFTDNRTVYVTPKVPSE